MKLLPPTEAKFRTILELDTFDSHKVGGPRGGDLAIYYQCCTINGTIEEFNINKLKFLFLFGTD